MENPPNLATGEFFKLWHRSTKICIRMPPLNITIFFLVHVYMLKFINKTPKAIDITFDSLYRSPNKSSRNTWLGWTYLSVKSHTWLLLRIKGIYEILIRNSCGGHSVQSSRNTSLECKVTGVSFQLFQIPFPSHF